MDSSATAENERWYARDAVSRLGKMLDKFAGSVAASTVATYVLGVGDRHLDNLMLTKNGEFFHVDFGFILGDDPKPFAPLVRLPREVLQALEFDETALLGSVNREVGGSGSNSPVDGGNGTGTTKRVDRLALFFRLCAAAFLELRKTSSLWVNMLRLQSCAPAAGGVPQLDSSKDPQKLNRSLATLRDRLLLHIQDEERAAAEFLKIILSESESLFPTLLDKLHNIGLFWA